MKNRFISSSLLALVFLAAPAAADTITLKDGTVLEGTILDPKADPYVIEYNVNKSGSIKDKKRVPRTDVLRIDPVRLDEKAFEEIAKLVPTPDLLTADDYQQRIDAVKAFLTKYPKGRKAKEAEAMLKKLTEEAAVVAAGGRKFDGLMMSGSDYRANAYDMDARVLEMKIQELVKVGRWMSALRIFAEMDKDFQGAASYRAVTPAVVRALQAFRGQINASLSTFDARMEKRAADLETMPAGERAKVERALAEQDVQLEARYQAEKAAQQAWVTPHRDHRQSLEDCSSFAESEIQRLTSPPEASTTGDPGKAYRAAWKTLRGEADAEEVEQAMTEAEASGLPEKYLTMLKDAAKASGAVKSEEP